MMTQMLPQSDGMPSDFDTSESHELLPTKTYKIDWQNKRIIGTVDGREACMQFIHKLFSTDKYAFEIYDWFYGNEIYKLIGQPFDYVSARIPKVCKEALMVDDRIVDVRKFTCTQTTVDSATISFIVDTVYGPIEYSKEMKI